MKKQRTLRFYQADYDKIGIARGAWPNNNVATLEDACVKLGTKLSEWTFPKNAFQLPIPIEILLNAGAAPVRLAEEEGFGCMRPAMISDAIEFLCATVVADIHADALIEILRSAKPYDVFWFEVSQ